MSQFEKRVQLNKIIEGQLPEFLVADFPKAVELFKQYYVSLEHQGGNVDLVDNLDRYIRVDNLVPEVIVGSTTLSSGIDKTATTITVASTKGFPDDYGLLKIGDEIITYTGKTATTFTGCIRGFSGITGYSSDISNIIDHTNRQSLKFAQTTAAEHIADVSVTNLSAIFLQEFYKKLKRTFTPGFEDLDFVSDLDVGNFIKHARNFYQSKGIEESVRILFRVLYGVEAKVIDLETRLVKPSAAEYVRREVFVVENLEYLDEESGLFVSGDPFALEGQTITRSLDPNTRASVSDVEIFTRNNKTFYRLGVFVGYNDKDFIEGTFSIPGASRVVEKIEPGDSTISVDSTIGFGQTGAIICERSEFTSGPILIRYTSKSVNQFYGCTQENYSSGMGVPIPLGKMVRFDDCVYGYENGDTSKRVDLRITGVLSEFDPVEDIPLMEEDEEIVVQNLGEVIGNPSGDKTYTEVFANSWIYNTSTRFIAESASGSTFVLTTDIDKSSLKVGDLVEIVSGTVGVGTVVVPPPQGGAFAEVSSINFATRTVTLSNTGGFVANPLTSYSLRRKLSKATSSGAEIELGNDVHNTDILNLYVDNEQTEAYVASNSLPSYEVLENIIEASTPDGTVSSLGNFDNFYKAYNTVRFASPVDFRDGDEIVYTADNPFSGLESGETYYVKLVSSRDIKIYISKELLTSGEHRRVGPAPLPSTGIHRFTLKRHRNRKITDNRILRKFPLSQSANDVNPDPRTEGSVGMLIDGVEISAPDSQDKVYYGPLKKFEVLNGGKGFDIVTPPEINITSGATQAKVEPVIIGDVKDVLVDPQEFDVQRLTSLSLTGGNGSGCELEPVIGSRFRELKFDSRKLSLGGGVDIDNETITFDRPHNLVNGQILIYNQNGNDPLGIGDAYDPNNPEDNNLQSGDEYYIRVVNTSTVRLFTKEEDALHFPAGINTIGLSEATSASGIHKFRTESQTNLRGIKVLNPGSGYSYRKLRVKSSGISTQYNTFYFKNHGFETGEIVNYSTTGTEVVGLSTANQYSIKKVDNDTFRVINVGVAGTFTNDLLKSKTAKIESLGSGYQIFEYPPIKVEANYVGVGTFVFTPIITGPITDAYLYESGSGYGSTTFNIHKKPLISISKGKNAQLSPIIVNGRIEEVQILNKGTEYASVPDITIEDTSGTGNGAVLRPVVKDGKIDDIIVINTGIGYSATATSIYIDPRGEGAIFDTRVRDLTVNDAFRFGKISINNTEEIFASLLDSNKEDYLNYGIYGYSQDLAKNLEPLDGLHSPIIGWAYDGNPIYGPFAYQDADVVQSGIKRVESGYQLDSSSVPNRPPFDPGFFIEDYVYRDNGDLDVHNGRFCKTPEFPNGVYAYFVGVTTSSATTNFIPQYPYFVGNTFKSNFIIDNNVLDQTYDFNGTNLVRNTFPYNVDQSGAEYDFFNESYETFEQESVVESVTKGSVPEIKIIDGGQGYRIGDGVNFSFAGTGGSGLRGEVTELSGAGISSITTTLESYPDSVFVWKNDSQVAAYNRFGGYDLVDKNVVLVSGLSTSIARLEGSKTIGISTETIGLASTMSAYGGGQGPLTESIYVSGSLSNVSIGNSIRIVSSDGEEIVRLLNNYGDGTFKIKRFGVGPGVAHSLGSNLNPISDEILLPVKTSNFKSYRNDLVYFNARRQVAIGVTIGGSVNLDAIELPDGSYKQVSVPTRQIYLPNHPFKTGQKVKLSLPSGATPISASQEASSTTFFLPDQSTRESEVYIINRGPNYIGIATLLSNTSQTDGVFFRIAGGDSDEFLLETQKTQVTGDVSRITTLVSTSATHGLQNNDTIKLSVVPNTVVGFGTTAALNIKLDYFENKILVNPIGINSTGINLATNTFTYTNHGFKTSDKVYYNSEQVASGLSTGSYFVVKTSSDTFKLAETLYDSLPENESTVDISDVGGVNHTIGLINPQINVVSNGDLKFLLNDASLNGYEMKFYKEKEFINEYVSSGDSRDFNVVGAGGSIGIGSFGTASLTLNHSKNIPSKLYYTLEKGGYISTADTSVPHYSEINFVESEYNGTYATFGITTATPTSFKISPYRYPSVLNYNSSECDLLSYNTKSSNALNGSIANVKVISEGFNFTRLPKFTDVTSKEGVNANIQGISTSIGRINKIRFKDVGYDYPSDNTLRPEAFVPPIIGIDNLDVFKEADIKFPGARYLNSPNVFLWNETRQEIVDKTSLIAEAPHGAIAEIKQIAPIYGLESEPHKIICVDNSNGVGIVSMLSGPTGIATCVLETPVLGFNTPLFAVGDEVFVEGVEQAVVGVGTGFNSRNYNYKFFKVTDYQNTSPAKLTFAIVDENGVGLSTNAGVAKTYQDGFATIINKSNYPIIDVIQERAEFAKNERLYVSPAIPFGGTPNWEEQDLFVSVVRDDYIKIKGRYKLKVGEKIKGIISGSIADVISIDKKKARFKIEYSSKVNIGWKNDIGKLSEDYQVVPNNDYYQNLSYSIKSPITWEESSNPVNSIIHPAGLKNFVDVGVTSTGNSGVGLGGSTTSIVILDVVGERRVDIINNFDNALDDNPRVSPLNANLQQSNALRIQNRKLNDYVECRTNRVLIHDDISNLFSSRGFKDGFVEVDVVNFIDNNVRYLIQIQDPDTGHLQLSDLVLQTTTLDSFLFEKQTSFTDTKLGDFTANIDNSGRRTLIFTPTDPFDRDHDIKILKKTYLYRDLPLGQTGIGTQSFGSVDLTSVLVSGITSVGTASSIKTIKEFDTNNFNGAFANIEVSNQNGEINNIEAVLSFDGTDTFIQEYYFDAQSISYSASQTGIVTAVYDSSVGIVTFQAQNLGISSINALTVRADVVGFAATSAGIGTYRFLLNNQPAGTERSGLLESTVGYGTDVVHAGTFSFELNSSASSIVKVSAGSTSAIHQVYTLANEKKGEVTVVPGPFAPVNNVTGLGTFGAEIFGDRYHLNFYPDSGYDVTLQSFNEVFYQEMDFDNQALPLQYGPTNQLLYLSAFDGLNGLRANRVNFPLTYEGKPIYNKSFDPTDTTKLDYGTGEFTMTDHFFNTGEELRYIPTSTFAGVGQTSMGIGQTTNYAGILTDKMPSTVFAIAITPDTFKLAATELDARSGVAITFTDAGLGNKHELEFTKKLSKTVIGIDGIVQQPITFTPISHELRFNGHYYSGGIPAGINTFNVSGISSIQPSDLLRIDDEYMKVETVGFTSNFNGEILGPISGVIQAGAGETHATVSVVRGSVGSAATSHLDGTTAQLYRGSFNIVENQIFFTDPPKGNTRARRNEQNLPYVRSQFSGRTFLRQNYDENMIFDDNSDQFTGIGRTYTLKVNGIDTTGVSPGNGILFINGVFQTPSTENNTGNNYDLIRDVQAGVSSVVYTGITSVDGSKIQSEFDINQNQIPRGGLIVSLGSTPGLGYAPLYGASLLVDKDSNGTINNITGINTYRRPVSISTASYNNVTGVLTLETSDPHNLISNERVKLTDLEFSCDSTGYGTTTIFPDYGYASDIGNVISSSKLTVLVGTSTIPHTYEGGGTISRYYDLSYGSGYRYPVSIGVTDLAYDHRFVSSSSNSLTDNNGANYTPTAATYISHTGLLVLEIGSHSLTTSNTIAIGTDSLVFTCSQDNFFGEHPYPRSTDPVAGIQTAIIATTSTSITVNVGKGGGGGTGASVEAIVGVGGTLAFNITSGGTDYVNPRLIIPEPIYENIPIEGVSRLGVGATTEVGKNLLLNLEIGQSAENSNPDRFFDASNLIVANTAFIADVAYGRMRDTYPSYNPPAGTNGQDCKDDIVDVLESVAYNLRYGGNDLTVDAADLYITGAHVAGEEQETINAFMEARDIAVKVMRNESVAIGTHTNKLQIKDTTITVDSNNPTCANVQSAIHTLVGIVTNAVDPTIATTPTRTPAPGAGFVVSNFKVARDGYQFKPGDVMKAVGLVTAKDYTQPASDFQLEVVSTFTDRFSSWSFGEMDFIDSVSGFQNGTRKRFPLFYRGELLSFELDPASPLSANIDLNSVLLIFVNGVLQSPGYSYEFTGGTSFIFTEAPQPQDKVDIFFYVGQNNLDSLLIDVTSTIKIGDDLFVRKHPLYTTPNQENSRTITDIPGSDVVETEIYTGLGVDENNFRPIDWIKQKNDLYVRGNLVSKARPVLEPKIFPTARVIGDITPSSNEIFVDNAQFFVYDNEILDVQKGSNFEFDAFLSNHIAPVGAEFTATVSAAGTISAITTNNVGAGYTVSSLDVRFSAPKSIGVGVGTTATATATITNGQVSAVTITNPGFGYTATNPPQTIIEIPKASVETINNVSNVQGFSGIITGISTCPGVGGHPLALKFNFTAISNYTTLNGKFGVLSDTNDLAVGYPVLIYDTTIGTGVTSVDSNNNSVVGIGTTFLDNVYKVHAKSGLLEDGEIICNIHSDSPVLGILATGDWNITESGICTSHGRISFGRIYNYDNRDGIAIGVTGLTVDAGLSTFPTIQRRGNFGEQKSGAIRSVKPPEDGVSPEADNYFPFYVQ